MVAQRLNAFFPQLLSLARGHVIAWDGNKFRNRSDRYIDVRDYDAACDLATDDSAALQDAIDAANARIVSGSGAARRIFIPAPGLAFSSQINLKSVGISGEGAFYGSRLKWTGAAGATAMVSGASVGGNSSKAIRHLSFVAGTHEPAHWLDVSGVLVDHQFDLSWVAFGGCTDDALMVGTFVNLHWAHLRWDNSGGYAIRVTPTADSGQSDSSFVLDCCTYDHSRTTSPGTGILLFDNTVRNGTRLGMFDIRGGRFEVNRPWETVANGATRAFVTWKVTGDYPNTCPTTLRGVTYNDNASTSQMADDVVFYRDCASTVQGDTFKIDNSLFTNCSAVIGGTWGGGDPTPSMPANGVIMDQLYPQAAANPDTSGATLAQLETEVNQLKAMLRSRGILGV